MKRRLVRRPLDVTFAFILAVTLLLPGVTSRSIASTATTSPNVASGPKVGDYQEDPVLDRSKFEPSSEEEDLTEPDDTLEDDDMEAVSDVNKTETTDLEEPPVVSNGAVTDDENDEDDALAFFSLLVKRAVDEEEQEVANDSEEAESETNSVDEDKFSISDLPKLLKPLIDAFSSESSSEAPRKDDFLSWFPSLKDLFEPSKPSGTEATSTATRSARRSGFSGASEPSLQAPPVSAQPPELEILSSSQLEYMTNIVPTVSVPPVTITKPQVSSSKWPITISPPDASDSAEDSETDF